VSVGGSGRPANDVSFDFGISAHGRYVAFVSLATNLVPGDTNRQRDVFVRDRLTDRTERVSVGPGGRQSNGLSWAAALSADGRFVAFTSAATNLVAGDTNRADDVFVRDRLRHTAARVSVGPSGRGERRQRAGEARQAAGLLRPAR
jgi:hypothetical protein